MFRNFKIVSQVVFGRGCFGQLESLLDDCRVDKGAYVAFLADDVFEQAELGKRIPAKDEDLILWTNADKEPTTFYVDDCVKRIRDYSGTLPAAVVGIGGGTVMDMGKAVAVMLKNPGSAKDYQGWDLVKHPGVYHVCVPTLSGTGAEVSRTAVLIGPEKKLGINSDYSVYDQLVLDPELIDDAPDEQRFFTGMDCYIHCVESLNGRFINAFSRAYGEKSLSMVKEVFLEDHQDNNDRLMMASYFGGMSIAYSQVGICHALSYGLSFVKGVRHGIGNCIVFDQLEEFYPESVREFRKMMEKNGIRLPKNIQENTTEKELEKMTDVALGLTPLWENAFGPGWRDIMTRDRIQKLYLAM